MQKHTWQQRVQAILRSNRFFQGVLAWLGLNAGWLAISGRYPMAHDEQFHLGLIRIYSERLTPFWGTAQPSGEALYGAVTRDPSYLYHYLVSIPFRLFDNIVRSEVGQVVTLRFVSIALVLLGLVIFRQVLLAGKFSKAVTHVGLAVFAVTPLVSLFASQVNYDPLLFMFTALTLRFTQLVAADIQSKKLDFRNLMTLAVVAMFGSLVKYAFLPIVLSVVLYLAWQARQSKLTYKPALKQLRSGFKVLSTSVKVLLVGSFVVLVGMNVERYGVNTMLYRTPTPECDQVIGVERCMAYSPWRRNYLTTQSYKAGRLQTKYTSKNFVRYSVTIWGSKMTDQLFFAIDGASSNYKIGKPFRIPRIASVTFMLVGIALFVWQFRKFKKRFGIGLLLLVSALYAMALLGQNYKDFVSIGYPYAIQGRYLLPILPLVYVMLAQAYASALAKYKNIALPVAAITIVLFATQAGGASTYILRSNEGWWWPNQTIVRINQTAQRVIDPLVLGN